VIEINPVIVSSLRERCQTTMDQTERVFDDMVPREFVRTEITGQKGVRTAGMIHGVATGLLVFAFWSWIISATGAVGFLTDLGVPLWIAGNIPLALSLMAASATAMIGVVSEAIEVRHRLHTQLGNASKRAGILAAALREIGDMIPGAVPEISHLDNNWKDDQPNALVERAMGRLSPPFHRNANLEPRLSGG
jgi:hypothetical protein